MVKKRIFHVKLEKKSERIDGINRSNFRRVDDFTYNLSTCQNFRSALWSRFFGLSLILHIFGVWTRSTQRVKFAEYFK